jgi:hypothetical protein|tara:strand:- start:50 stop:277 length:228 start_codon:yes stop_codon:yes gene_type:complete
MLEFDDMELMQLQFCMQQTEKQMSMGGEIRRHASITKKIEEEMQHRKETKGSYTPENVRLQLEEELRELLKRRDG